MPTSPDTHTYRCGVAGFREDGTARHVPSYICDCRCHRLNVEGNFDGQATDVIKRGWENEHIETDGQHFGMKGPGSSAYEMCPLCAADRVADSATAEIAEALYEAQNSGVKSHPGELLGKFEQIIQTAHKGGWGGQGDDPSQHDQIRTVKIGPETWLETLNPLLALMNSSSRGREFAIDELRRMAGVADAHRAWAENLQQMRPDFNIALGILAEIEISLKAQINGSSTEHVDETLEFNVTRLRKAAAILMDIKSRLF